ncbi:MULTISPECIES: LytTR family DNA-binding domain-containing protein [unclassified Sphingomonas]|jgi:two-component system response regulator AlgR|uniref:LytR/AlgR family response regulator transcription factor n=1 Tax=Sphingomonas TaxID=13687 RepID=UPI000967CAD5|nr:MULTISPECIES: LytTR family DNA-binding domain-containing protein [unclassified Sphingomonas]MBN8810280.1 response regulator transcription factor [Sphingomonas sp.]OJY50833.1 MAG: DNA-binding response regulator [Sphingomonas sp. 67-41]
MNIEPTLRTLIVDDEPLAIERLVMLCSHVPNLSLAGTASDGEVALRLARSLSPDLVLLDIAMPEVDGMDVAKALCAGERPPAIVFCTAFDGFALAAFDVAAVDYLLKPVTSEGLVRAVARARRRMAGPERQSIAQSDRIEEFWVPHRSEMVRIAAMDVERIDAMRDYMSLQVGSRSFLLHRTLGDLERRLDPARFIRVHRSTIVRRDFIARLRHDGLGIWYAMLADGAEVRVGRSYLAAVKALAGR